MWNTEVMQQYAWNNPSFPQTGATVYRQTVYDGDGTSNTLMGHMSQVIVYGPGSIVTQESFMYDMAGNCTQVNKKKPENKKKKYNSLY